jgi:L-lysine exporter family protein LysE/ArgO
MVAVLIEGFLLGVAVSLSFGPVNVEMIRRALAQGFWNATAFGGGSASADLVYIGLVYFGLAPLLDQQIWVRVGLLVLGALWLGWLALGSIRSARQVVALGPEYETDDTLRSYVAGVGVTLLNPLTITGWIFQGGSFFARHPETRTASGGLWALLAIQLGLMAYVVIVSALLATGRRWVKPTGIRSLSLVAGVMLLMFAAGLLLSAMHDVSQALRSVS